MTTTPPALLVASTPAVDKPMTPEELDRAVAESAAAAIAQLPSKESRRSYECVWRFYLRWLGTQQLHVTNARPRHITAYVAQLKTEKGKPQKKGSRARTLTVIRSIYGSLVVNELMLSNPAREVKGPKVDSTPNAPYIADEADIEKMMNVHEANDSWFARRDRLIVRMSLGLGLRRAEVARVTVEDFDDDALTVLVKGGRLETFGLPDFLCEEIFEWRQFAGIEAGPLFPRRPDDPRPINGAIVYRIVRQSCARVQIAVVPPHALRRTAVTYLREKGVPIKSCQLMLGHAQESTTGRYDKGRNARANKPGELLGKLVHR